MLLKISGKKAPLPEAITPQLCTLVDHPPSGALWAHEIKFDGYRLIAIKKNNQTKLFTRNQHDWTGIFKPIAAAINKLPIKNLILDGEVVVLDGNQHSNFQLLQNSIKQQQGHAFIYYVFDLIYFDKYNLENLPLLERKKILRKLITTTPVKNIRYSEHVLGDGEKIFKKICDSDFEGIVSKKVTVLINKNVQKIG